MAGESGNQSGSFETIDTDGGSRKNAGFDVGSLFDLINRATMSTKAKLEQIRGRQSAISIGDMFEMQMMMNHLSQLTEMAGSVLSASNTAIQGLARGVKG